MDQIRPREVSVIRSCLHARTLAPNGYYLVPPSERASAQRLIDRGMLTKADTIGPWGWLVALITQANLDAMNAKKPAPGCPGPAGEGDGSDRDR